MSIHLFVWCFEQFLRDGYFSLQGTVCDVRKGEDVKELVNFARDRLKYIDIWV